MAGYLSTEEPRKSVNAEILNAQHKLEEARDNE